MTIGKVSIGSIILDKILGILTGKQVPTPSLASVIIGELTFRLVDGKIGTDIGRRG